RIFFYSNGDFERIKSRALELMVLLSRASIEGGAEPGVIFSISDSFMEKAEEAENIEELSVLLSGIINRYIGYIFDFREIKHTDTVYKILSYVKNNYMRKITLDDIASSVYLSKSYLSGIFKDEMGISLTSYIQRIRIEKSVELMENTTLSLSEIADSTGFSDQSYFSKVFREITGFTPNKYRLKTTEEKQETIPPEGRRTGE
ncbi:MAG: helix-turn-helix transcriptional regulator, partial [Clostridiales bacterium]|nr:helix-turn-helix transcriptional regulator [Clostridiales bacterium]